MTRLILTLAPSARRLLSVKFYFQFCLLYWTRESGCSLVWQDPGELQRHIYLAAPLVGATLPIGLVSYVRGLRTQRRRQKWTKQLQIYLWLISSEVNTVEMGKKGKAFYGTPSQPGQLRIQPQPHLNALNDWTGLFSFSNPRKFHSQTGSATKRVESLEK